MKNFYALVILTLFIFTAHAQNGVLHLDGNSDYVSLGSNVGNGMRTVELWFKLDEEINTSNTKYVRIIGREVNAINDHEWHLSFTSKSSGPTPGKIRFAIVETLHGARDVLSNSSSWAPGVWYHVAGVVHPELGMMLFINGVKQDDTDNSYTSASATMNDNVEIGRQVGFDRNYRGSLDDVHITSDALYTTDFEPPCPNRSSESSTLGLYHLNSVSGTIAIDSSFKGENGTLSGCTWQNSEICDSFIIPIIYIPRNFGIAPNPSPDQIYFTIPNEFTHAKLLLRNDIGQTVLETEMITPYTFIDISHLAQAIYIAEIYVSDGIRYNTLWLKN